MSFQHAAIWLKLIIGSAPAPALDSHVVPVRSQSTPVTAEPRLLPRPAPHILHGCDGSCSSSDMAGATMQ